MKRFSLLFILIACLIGGVLAYLYEISEPIQARHREAKIQNSLEHILANLPHTRTVPVQLFAPNHLNMGDMQTAYRILNNETPIEFILVARTKRAYNDRITLMIAFDTQCSIQYVNVIDEKETPGLGDQYKKDNGAWLKSFTNQDADIDTWTGATITSSAIIQSVETIQQMCLSYESQLFGIETELYLENR